jgi:hypothetical protein
LVVESQTKAGGGSKHAVEILEDQVANYFREDGVKAMRQRGRLAEGLAKEHGFAGYTVVSFIELENAEDDGAAIEELARAITR